MEPVTLSKSEPDKQANEQVAKAEPDERSVSGCVSMTIQRMEEISGGFCLFSFLFSF